MAITLIHTSDRTDVNQAAAEERLCVCDCATYHPTMQVCSMVADTPGGICPGCDVDTLGADARPELFDYLGAAWSAWRVLSVAEAVAPAADGFLVVNATWAGHRRGGRPAAIRTAGYVTHVGIVAEVHPAAACPDRWDDEDPTTDCGPWGAAPDPARPRLSHWCLAEVVELPTPVRHKIAGWMTPRTCQAITAQL